VRAREKAGKRGENRGTHMINENLKEREQENLRAVRGSDGGERGGKSRKLRVEKPKCNLNRMAYGMDPAA